MSACADCGDRPAREGHPICFKCHLGGIRFGFRGGIEQFHNSTNHERETAAAKGIAQARSEGRDIEKLPAKATW